MKTKIKRHSRAVISVILTLCMLVSCMTVGIIATDAAKTAEDRVGAVDNSEALGVNLAAGTYYFIKPSGWTNAPQMVIGHNTYRDVKSATYNIDSKVYAFTISKWDNADGFYFNDSTLSTGGSNNVDYYTGKADNSTDKITSGTAGKLYKISSGNSGAVSSETYANITVASGIYLKTGNSFSEQTIGTASVSGKTIANATSSSSIAKYTRATFTASYSGSQYRFLGWYNSSHNLVSSDASYVISSIESNTTLYATYELNQIPLAAPSIKYNSSASNVNEPATEGVNATISWDAVTDAATYTVYKGEDVVSADQAGTSYSFPKSYASNGTYTVVAKPAGADTAHTVSAASNGIQFTFNKTTLATPVVTAKDTDTNLAITSPAELHASSGQVTFSWSKVTGAESYVVKEGTDTVTTIDATSANTYSYSVDKLESSTGNYTVTATSTKTDYYINSNPSTTFSLTVSKQTLAAPTGVSVSPNSVTLPWAETITLSWNSVTNAGKYQVFVNRGDGDEFVSFADNITTTSCTIPTLFTNAGTYKVKAKPSDADVNYYNASDLSDGAALAFDKTPVDAPVLTINNLSDNVTGDVGSTLTAKIENYADLSTYCDFELWRGTTSGTLSYKVGDFSGATYTIPDGDNKPGSQTGTDTYYTVKAKLKDAVSADYTLPTENSNSVKATLTKAVWNLLGETSRLEGCDTDAGWNTGTNTFMLSTFEKTGVYSVTITVGDEVTDNIAHIGFYNKSESSRYSTVGHTSSSTDFAVPNTGIDEDEPHTLTTATDGSFVFAEGKEYKIYIDQINGKLWIDAEKVKITTQAYYKDYKTTDGTYNDPVQGTTGGTCSPATQTVDKGSENNEVSATPASGYHFVGWYASTDFTQEALSESTTYSTYTAARSATLYALFEKDTYTVTVNAGANGSVAAGSVPSGFTPVTLPTATPEEGYVFLNWTTESENLTLRNINSADGATVAATGTGTVTANFAPAITASAQVKGDGTGTVTVNGTADTKQVPKGGEVTFVATPGANCSFYGWFNNADCAPEHRVSTSLTYKVKMTEGATYYALINFSNHKLWGNGALLHWGDGKADLGDADITFTQSSSDARIYNVKVDMKRTTHVAVSVYPGSPNTYQAAEDESVSGTAASATRVNYDTEDTNKWKVLGETDVKGLNFEWNALTKTLSWTETAIDPNEYTIVYVKDNDYAKGAYVWSASTKVFGEWPGADLSTFPTVTIGDDTYRVIYLTEDSFGGDTTFGFKINDNNKDNPAGAEYSGLEIGKSYTIERTADNEGDKDTTHYGLTARTLTVNVPKVNGDTVATAYISKVNGAATTGEPTSLNNVFRGDDIEVTYEFAEGMEPKYDYKDTTGVQGASENTKVVSFQMPNADATAKINFKEYDDTFYIADKANWGSGNIRLHIWTHGDTDVDWCTWATEPGLSTSAQDWTPLTKVDGDETVNAYSDHTVMYKYDADKELFLVKGLSTNKVMSANTYMIIHKNTGNADTDQTKAIQGVKKGALYKTAGNASAVVNDTNFNYDTYDPYAVAWPPDDVSAYSADSDMYLRYSNNDQFDTTGTKKANGILVKKDSGNTGFWIDLTDLLLNDLDWGNFYFFLTSNNDKSGIQGNENNYLIDADDSGNYTGKQSDKSTKTSLNLPSSGTKLLGAEIKQNGTVHDSTKYGSFNYIDRKKLTHVGLFIQNTDGKIMYKVYYTGGGSPAKSKTVKVYAKDSTLRSGYTFYNKYATTNLTDSSYNTAAPKYYIGEDGTDYTVTPYADGGIHTYDYTPAVPKGSTIYFKTVMDSSDMKADSGAQTTDNFRSRYYLKGFSINGTVYSLFAKDGTEAESGTYTQSFTIPEDWPYDYVEITPIYWLKDPTNTLVFYVQGYTDEVRNAGWGNTIGVYPFYQDEFNVAAKGSQNAYGGYPGQPLVNYKGDLFAQIPVEYAGTNENNVPKTMYIKGVTMSNMFWDYVHLATGEVDKHHQTYDYDDLYKIYHEEKDLGINPDNIICSFKYRNNHNNDEPNSLDVTQAGLDAYTNGWDDLLDFYGNPVDIFGNTLLDNENQQPLYVISQDYRSNCAGRYATEWAVYDSDGTKITTIAPSVLVLESDSRFDNYDAETLKFKTAYQTLDKEVYKGRPVKITYEQSIWGGSDQAERCDARWYFSRNDAPISATIRIQTSEDNGRTWTEYENLPNTGVATVGGDTISAEFKEGTRKSADDVIHTNAALTLDKEQYYEFLATEGTDYKFDSWQVIRDGAMQEVSKIADDHAPRSGNAEFIARFKHVVNNKFSLYHEVHPQSAGVGTVLIEAEKHTSAATTIAGAVAGNKVASSEKSGTSVTFDVSNDDTNVILATFTATPRADSTFENFYETVSNVLTDKYGNKLDYILDFTIDTENKQFKVLYDIDKLYSSTTLKVASETFYSRFGFKERDYQIDYYFDTRAYGKKVYTVTGTITSDDARNYFKDQLATDIGFSSLNATFVSSKTPTESNFAEDLKWNSKDVVILPDEGTTLRAKLVADQNPYNVCRAKIVDEFNSNSITKIIETTRGQHFIDPDTGTDYQAQNTEHISYWKVYQYKGGSDMVEIARCYGSSFNYTAYEDYYIVAVYDAADSSSYSSRQDAYNHQQKGYISLLSTSRNHWNNCAEQVAGVWQIDNDSTGVGYNEPNKEFDRLYMDFVIGYDFNGVDLSQNASEYTIQYKVDKYVGKDPVLKTSSTKTVSKVDNKNRVHCTLGIGNSEENADYYTKFVITPVLMKDGVNVLNENAGSIEVKMNSIANSDREWVE